jgi:hypothetical protein
MINKYFYMVFTDGSIEEIATSVERPEPEGRRVITFDMNILSPKEMLEVTQVEVPEDIRSKVSAGIKLFFK